VRSFQASKLSSFLAACLLACGHAAPATSASSSEVSCEAASDRTRQVSDQQAPPDLIARYHDVQLRHCKDDRWSAAVRRCYGTLASADAMNACEDQLTPEQRKALHDDFDK
jgi:hypothetical protein